MKYFYYLFQRLLFFAYLPKRKRKIVNVVYKVDAIGDFILASEAMKKLFSSGNHPWVLICAPLCVDIARDLYPDVAIKSLSRGRDLWLVFLYSQNVKCQDLICLKHSRTGIDNVVIQWLRPKRSYGIIDSPLKQYTPSGFKTYIFTHSSTYPTERTLYPLELEAHAKLLAKYDLDISCLYPRLEKKQTTKIRPLILAVYPFTKTELRNYPCEILVKVLQEFHKLHPDVQIYLSGGPNEIYDLQSMLSKIPVYMKVRLKITYKAIDSLKFIESVTAVLSMESGPAHIATAYDKPGVFILGGGHFDYFAPWCHSEKQKWIYYKMNCFGCHWKCIHDKTYCITNILDNKIVESLTQVLSFDEY